MDCAKYLIRNSLASLYLVVPLYNLRRNQKKIIRDNDILGSKVKLTLNIQRKHFCPVCIFSTNSNVIFYLISHGSIFEINIYFNIAV